MRAGLSVALHRLNIGHQRRHGREVPRVFEGAVDQEKLARISAYTADSACLGLITSLSAQFLTLVILLSGFLPWLTERVTCRVSNPIGAGMIFFALLSVVFNLPQIPFSLYETFVVEERHGFNTKTPRIWFFDLVKGTVLSAALGGTVLCLLLILIVNLPHTWWIWAWLVLALLEALFLWLYPVWVAPWFNRFERIENERLEGRIRRLMGEADLGVKGVFQMDAGKRTRHTNAYFTGLGRTKRIVLFDSLLKAHTEDEILAILAHEAGHWRKRHIMKELALLEAVSFFGLFLMAKLLEWPLLYETFGFREPLAFVGLFLVSTLLGLVGYFFRPVASGLSRRFERQADDTATELTRSSMFLSRALRKLAVDNLANLNPHPLYAWFYYSHPPIVDRIERLERTEGGRRVHEAKTASI